MHACVLFQVFKVLHLLYLHDWFVFAETITGRKKVGTSTAYMCHNFFLQLEKNSFYYWGVAIWNSLPPSLCNIDCLSNFMLFLFLLFVISFYCCIPYFVFTVVMSFVWLYLLFLFCVLAYFSIGHCWKAALLSWCNFPLIINHARKFIAGKTRGGNLLSAGNVWAWGNHSTQENIYHCDLWFGRLLVMCAGKHGSLGICVRGNTILGETHITVTQPIIGSQSLIEFFKTWCAGLM